MPKAAIDRPAGRRPAGPQHPDRPALDALVAAWPGPAARLSADGRVMAANPAAAALLDELRARVGTGGFGTLVEAALADRQARSDTLVVAAEPAAVTFDYSLVPVSAEDVLLLGRDVSLATNLRQALGESRQRFKDLVEISSDFAWETDAAGAFTFVSPKGALGWKATDLLGRSADSFLADADDAGAHATPFVTRVPVDQVELWLRRRDGAPACVAISAVPLRGTEGTWNGARGVWRDVTEVHAREAALAEAETRERLVGYLTRTIRDEVEPEAMLSAAASAIARALGAAGCRIWDIDREGNLATAMEFGVRAPESLAIERHMTAHVRRLAETGAAAGADRDDQAAVVSGDDVFLGVVTRFRRQINGAVGLWRGAAGAWSESDRAVMAKIADQIGIAQEQIANHEALARQARTDALTGLLNRRGFAKRLERQLGQCAASNRPGTLVYVDLDNFKAVNDRLGHPAGDAALKGLAAALRGAVRAGDLVARLGGDEFALWLVDTDVPAAIERARQILALTAEIAPYSAGPDKPLGLSVGVAVHVPGSGETTAELLDRADQAMYTVKKSGKGSYTVAPDVETFRASRNTAP